MLMKMLVAIAAMAMATLGTFFYPEAPQILGLTANTLSLIN